MPRVLLSILLAGAVAAPVTASAAPPRAPAGHSPAGVAAVRAAGSDVRRLTLLSERALTRDGHAHLLAWSPRGDHLLYLSNQALWITDSAGRQQRRIVSGQVADATFTADGAHILYQSLDSHSQPNGIVRVDTQGRGARRLAGADYSPVYSGAGSFSITSLAGSLLRDGRLALERGGHLFALDPRRGTIASLGSYALPAPVEEGALPTTSAALSPDGRRVASFGLSNGLVVYEARNGRMLRRVVPSGGAAVRGAGTLPATAASWSPDGHTLVYELGGTSGALMATDTNSGRRWTLLRVGAETISGLAWSPDGAMLAFSDVATGSNTATLSEIKLVNAGGTGLRTLDAQATRPGWLAKYKPGQLSPLWAPGGRAIAYTRISSVANAIKTDVWLASLHAT